jgi:queuine/archaeosine tRNA-ribosyltransferase
VALKFQIDAKSGAARAGRLITPHGEVKTPVFMPVGTLATVKSVPQETLEELGVQILLSNTYHLYLRPGVEQVRRLGGLHKFMAWPRAILTDSGGFQVFSLNELRKMSEEGVKFRSHLDGSEHFFTPESAMAAQIGLGADIIMAFDECTEYPADGKRARESMELTLRWAARSKNYFEEHQHEVGWAGSGGSTRPLDYSHKAASGLVAPARDDTGYRDDQGSGDDRSEGDARGSAELRSTGQPGAAVPTQGLRGATAPTQFGTADPTQSLLEADVPTQSLFGIVQGGMDRQLRKESAERTIEIGFPGYSIGGLSVGEPRALTREIVGCTLEHLPGDRPRYLMGVGTPEEIVEYASLGVDMMDCVLPTRAARHGLLFTSRGRISIKQAQYAGDENQLDPQCGCRVCARYSRAYLRHLYASNEVLAQVLNTIHNLSFYLDTMRRVRHSIELGREARFLSEVWPQ